MDYSQFQQDYFVVTADDVKGLAYWVYGKIQLSREARTFGRKLEKTFARSANPYRKFPENLLKQ
jgi:hypothetical protein